MTPFEYIALPFGLLVLFCGFVPLLGATMLCNGFQVMKIGDVAWSKCARVFFAAVGAAYVASLASARMLPEVEPLVKLLASAAIVVAIEMLAIVVMMRKFTRSAVLVEATAVVVANVAGYAFVLNLVLKSSPIQAGR